ncbi:MAG TPA: SDR family NAD(P)-dependent oxidoreductase [Xanthobacteraceae bacterium]|jgi:NAD(P)-dependent dehydrogenase (short-subunit alcohol dehydrogenase family)
MTKPLANKIALVTGASRGIGKATAMALANAGAHVVALARTTGGLEELDDAIQKAGGSATLVPADLKDGPALDRLGASLYERYKRLDVLVANAAILGTLSPLGHIDAKVWDEVIAINLTANWRLIRSLDLLLRQSEAGRAVFLTSSVTFTIFPYWGAYAASKAGLEMLARTYAAETEKTNVKVNIFNPGPTRTRMRAQAMPGEDPMTLDPPHKVAEHIVPLCLPSCDRSGAIYDYRVKRWLEFQPPKPV